jgi:hypothetical protein
LRAWRPPLGGGGGFHRIAGVDGADGAAGKPVAELRRRPITIERLRGLAMLDGGVVAAEIGDGCHASSVAPDARAAIEAAHDRADSVNASRRLDAPVDVTMPRK